MTRRALTAVAATAAAMTLLMHVAPALAQDPGTPSPAANPGVPPADRPLVTKIPSPRLMVEAGAGILGYVGGTAQIGPAWNVRVTGYFSPRWGAELEYMGSANSRSDRLGGLVYTSFTGDARLNILRPDQAPVLPFVAVGIGYVGFYGPYGDGAAAVFPLQIGLERMLTQNIKIGARFNYRPALGDNLGVGPNQLGGDTWTILANLGGGF